MYESRSNLLLRIEFSSREKRFFYLAGFQLTSTVCLFLKLLKSLDVRKSAMCNLRHLCPSFLPFFRSEQQCWETKDFVWSPRYNGENQGCIPAHQKGACGRK